MIKDKFFRYTPLFLAASIGSGGIHGLMDSGNTNLLSHCMAIWLAWFVLLMMRFVGILAITFVNGDSLIQLSVWHPLILIPLSFIPLEVIETHADELSITPIWVCILIAGVIVMGSVRFSEIILSWVSNPLMTLLFRISRKGVNRPYAQNIPVICRSCIYCTAHKDLLCAIRPRGPEHPRHCQSFVAKENNKVL